MAAVGITALVAKGFNMVKDSVQRAFGRIDTMEQFERVMTTLTGSTDKANEVLDKVNDTVKGTAYGLDVGAKAVQGFVTSNMDVDKATMTFEAWGDAVAFYGDGTNATLGSVTDALAKATAKGKIQMDTMNSLAEAGIPAMQIYADATGRSVEQVADEMSKGKIKADEFHEIMNKAMIEGTKSFESIKGAAKEAGASWSGSFDNMHAAVARGVIAIIQNIDEMLVSNGLPDMREMVALFGAKFEEVLKKVADAVPVVFDKLKEVFNVLKPWLPLIGAIGAAFISYVAIMQSVTAAQKAWDVVQKVSIALTKAQRAAHLAMVISGGGVKGVLLAMRAAMSQLNKTMMLNPWVLVAAAAVAAVILIYKYWEPISGFFINLWNAIKTAGIAIWDEIKVAWTTTVEWFKLIWSTVAEFFSGLWSYITGFAIAIWDTVIERWSAVIDFVYNIFGPLIDFYSGLWTTIVDTALEIWETFTSTLSVIWENIQTIAGATWEIIKNVILGPILLLINLVTGDMEEFKNNLTAIWNNIKSAGKTIWESLKNIFIAIVSALIKTGLRLWENFKSAVSGLWQALKNTASNIWESLKTAVVRIIANLVSSAMQKWNDLKSRVITVIANTVSDLLGKWNELKTKTLDRIKGVKDNVINPLKEINLMQIGKDIIQGLINGIKNKVKAVGNAVKEVTSQITGKIKSILKIASPSKITTEDGGFVGEGIVVGMLSKVKNIAKAATEMARAAIPELQPVDFTGQVSSINRQAHRQMQSHLTSELTVNNKQPAYINLSIGNRDFEVFVEDISEAQDRNAQLKRMF